MTSPIAIDRSSGKAALKQIVEQGKDRLKKGFWIVIFPEGTRIAPGEKGKYRIGGAWLATHTGVPVVPVAHNAGEYLGKKCLDKTAWHHYGKHRRADRSRQEWNLTTSMPEWNHGLRQRWSRIENRKPEKYETHEDNFISTLEGRATMLARGTSPHQPQR